MFKKHITIKIIIIILVLIIGALIDFYYVSKKTNDNIIVTNFTECMEAGFPIMESYPRKCKDGEGNLFIEEIVSCTNSDGDYMTLDEAKAIAIKSECGNNLKENAFCNEITGTFWIDLNLEKEGCNPACVINIKTKEAEINWRCTGLKIN